LEALLHAQGIRRRQLVLFGERPVRETKLTRVNDQAIRRVLEAAGWNSSMKMAGGRESD
jgi:hypothetical protein